MKAKFDIDSKQILDQLKKQDDLYWNGAAIYLNKYSLLYVRASYENPNPKKRSIEEMISSKGKDDYSKYETKLSFYVRAGKNQTHVFDYWKHEFESLEDHTIFDQIFEEANKMLLKLREEILDLFIE